VILIATVSAPIGGAAIGLAGVLVGLWISGNRTERQRRRDLHARALVAVIQYGEMPFMIRRRKSEAEYRSAERVRLSDHFSSVKAEVSTCEVLIAADGDQGISTSYKELVQTARRVVGKEAREAWKDEPIQADSEMNMGPLFERLEDFRIQLNDFEDALARATLPRRLRLARRLAKS
jgi:hypothetical protein